MSLPYLCFVGTFLLLIIVASVIVTRYDQKHGIK